MNDSDLNERVDRLIDERPGKELLTPVYDDPARRITDFLYRSGGTTAAYMLLTEAGRVIVNTGLGYEAPHHKRVFDAVCPGPTPHIVTTQAHVDHVGGVDCSANRGRNMWHRPTTAPASTTTSASPRCACGPPPSGST